MVILVIGGADSGKSAFAEALTAALSGHGSAGSENPDRIYLATMEGTGSEARSRIARHRALRRDRGFQTVERSRDLRAVPVPDGAAVLVEDLPNLMANERFHPEGGGYAAALEGLACLWQTARHTVMVTGDLFSGGEYTGTACASGRTDGDGTWDYLRDLAMLNRAAAARSDVVVELLCGLPVLWKGTLDEIGNDA